MSVGMKDHMSTKSPAGGASTVSALSRIYRRLPRTLSRQLLLLLALMLAGALAELMTIGAVLPFLTFLANEEGAGGFAPLRHAFGGLGFISWQEQVLAATLLFAGMAILAGAIRIYLFRFSQRYVFRVGYEIGRAVFGHVLKLPYSYHIRTNSSEVIAGVNKIQMVIIGVLLQLMQALIAAIMSVFLIAALIAVDAAVALITAAAFGSVYGLITVLTRRRLSANSRAIAGGQTKRVQTVQDGLGGIRDVIIDQTRGHFARRFNTIEGSLRDAQASNAFVSTYPRVIVEVVGMALIAVLAYVLVSGSGGIAAALPVLGALALGAQRLLPLLQQVYSGWSISMGNRQALFDVLDLLDEPLPIASDVAEAAAMPAPHLIEFANVGFRYSERTAWVVRDFSLSVPRGTRAGIVGKTGSGKSTVMDLLMALLEPVEGEVRVDGRRLDQHNRRAWQRQIAHVPQAIYLSDASVAENIAFGTDREAIDMERVREAARMAELHDFIEALPSGYATFVGERGIRLSGGQRQRIGIARALYKQASVIVFDEATSALDNQTEAAVMRSIFGLRRDLTVFIIAHRLSTVEGCDLVVSLSEGRIDRIGTFDEVIPTTAHEGSDHAR